MKKVLRNKGIVGIVILFVFLISATLFLVSRFDLSVDDVVDAVKGSKENIYEKFSRANCDEPLKYSIGDLDSRFGVPRQDIISALNQAENVWENAVNKDLFVYTENPEGDDVVMVNFIFDERQAQFFAARSSETSLEQKWNTYEQLLDLYEYIKTQYEEHEFSYNQQTQSYERLLESYEAEVEKWNRKNGGSRQEYERLNDQQEALNNMYSELEKEEKTLRELVKRLNELADKINALQEELDIETDVHNERYADQEVFTSGDYQNYEINVYQFENRNDLVFTLTHELGHSLGVDHVDDENSIMNFISVGFDKENLVPTEKDINALKEVCNF